MYNGLGRLTGVIDPAGDVARYAYDAVGNLLSISRQSSALASVIEIVPASAPVGSTVTIYGTGFSTTPSQNAVQFTGAAATVTAATATQLVATVPAGAATGTVTVTAPAGSASSTAPFTVSAPTAPTIGGVSPTIAPAGAAVTITGTNFESTLANDKLTFNTTLAMVSAATATTLQTTVPLGTGSGRMSVTTPGGQALAADDFFVPPTPYTAPDVAIAGRMAIGDARTITFSAPSKIALLAFDGTAGQGSAWR